MDNLEHWNKMCDTPPEFLKRVSIGRGFTAIDPMYQIQKMTEVFGPVGQGWGWYATMKYHETGPYLIVTAEVSVWHSHQGNSFGPFPGCRTFVDKSKDKRQVNEEAPKMAVTDGLTKALSHIGMSADVFLGKHDGSKYEQQHNNNGGW
jgi:hypothetical protein